MSKDQDESAGDADALERARRHYAARAWAQAHAAFMQADQHAALTLDDLQCCVWTTFLLGRLDDLLTLSERLYQARLEQGAYDRAARCAFWAGLRLSALADSGRAGAWLSRAQRMVERWERDCPERGYLLLPAAQRQLAAGDAAAAHQLATEAVAIGERHADRDLTAFGRSMQGRILIRLGRIQEGLSHMDEAMLAGTSGELSPIMTGLIYCSVIAGCQQVFALDRAREWTQALERWWVAQPQVVAFAGSCLVHRAELLELDGAWPNAIDEAQRATSALNSAVEPQAAAAGWYRQGEIHRLRGEHALAEQAYRQANEMGRDPQPGLALLRLAQGQSEAAANAIRRVLASVTVPLQRAQYLPAFCEIMLALGDLESGRVGSQELRSIASSVGSEFLAALADHAEGALAIAHGQPEAALELLQRALAVWQRVPAPYLVARLRVLLARAYGALADHDSASLECDAARPVFLQLGAAPDLERLDAHCRATASGPARAASNHSLSARELEVLRLVATGKTNKRIARELGLSEKTIARHVSNIFTKLDVDSRAAATAYAYENRLV